MTERESIYLEKAHESLAGAVSEYANSRYNNCANSCYYACFQAAVHALTDAGVPYRGTFTTWPHERLQAEFVGQLINRRKVYPAELRDTLPRTYALRQAGDYKRDHVSETQAFRALRRARTFVQTVMARGGEG
jgi:uncharacterized protein (UPF0332 family)